VIDFLVPAAYAEEPSGGNIYARRLVAGLGRLGHEVVVHEGVVPARPHGTVVVDGLLGLDHGPQLLELAARHRLVLLAHMPFGHEHERALVHAATVVVTTSGWTRRWLAEHYELDPAHVLVAEPGVQVGDPARGTEGGHRLLSVGAVSTAKGHDVLLEALAAVADLDWHCALVGPLDRDPEAVQKVRQLAADAGLAGRVLLAGPRPHERMPAAYATADLLVHASQVESYGMVVTEALAHAVPVVAAATGGVPEALGNGPDGSTPGLLVPPDDPAALSGALRRWLTDPLTRQRLRRSAGLRRLGLPSWSGTCARVAEVLT